MARRIAHRDLRNDSARILREVAAGETFEVTNHGEVVAVLGPPTADPFPLALRPARRAGGFAALRAARSSDGSARESTGDALDALREER